MKYSTSVDFDDQENFNIIELNNPYESRNQYSEIIPPTVYIDYKKAMSINDIDMMEKIKEWVFSVCRKINKFPKKLVTKEELGDVSLSAQVMISMLRPLGSINFSKGTGLGDCYDGESYGLNSAGVGFLYSFFPNIWDVTKKTCPMSMRQGFFDDEKLKIAIRKTLSYGNNILDLISWLRMQGLGYCVNFRPAVAKTLYEAHAPDNAKVYDFANGYGARCLGAIFANNVSEYISVDVNTETVGNTKKMIHAIMTNNELRKMMSLKNKKIIPYLCGSEEFLQKYPEYKGYFDLSFSSPQYFNTEIYSQEETQSCHKYPQYKMWLKNFYRPTIHNAIDVLKEDGVFIINIFEKLPSISGASENFDLKKMTKVFAAEKGFYLYKCDKYLLRTMAGIGKKIIEDGIDVGYEKKSRTTGDTYEAVWMFRHYESLFKMNYISIEEYEIYKQRHEKRLL